MHYLPPNGTSLNGVLIVDYKHKLGTIIWRPLVCTTSKCWQTCIVYFMICKYHYNWYLLFFNLVYTIFSWLILPWYIFLGGCWTILQSISYICWGNKKFSRKGELYIYIFINRAHKHLLYVDWPVHTRISLLHNLHCTCNLRNHYSIDCSTFFSKSPFEKLHIWY